MRFYRYSYGPGLSVYGWSPMVKTLIIANALVFLLQFILPLRMVSFFGLVPAMVVNRLYLWQPFTYMFLHGGFFHLFFNMFVLWMFGSEVEGMWGSREFLRYYFITGIGAAIIYTIASYIFPALDPNIPTIGASGAIFGLIDAFAMLYPNRMSYNYFLFPGRLERTKGVQVVIPAFQHRTDVDLLIAGAGNYEAELRLRASGASNIKFLGRVSQERLQSLYRQAVATLVPSLCYETFGLVVAESFSTATPVIVHGQSSLAEIVTTHGGGLMYRTLDELGAAIDTLRADTALRQRLGSQGRDAYEAEFAAPAFLSHYLDVVRALLAKKRAGEPLRAAGDDACAAPLGGGRAVCCAPES